MTDSLYTTFLKDFLAGGTSGAISASITAPVERIKIILQVQKSSKIRECTGIIGCAKHVFYTQGFLSFWRGNLANTIRLFPTSSINFAVKERFRTLVLNKFHQEKDFFKLLLGNIIAGSCAGFTCLAIVYPLDFTRTRLAADIDKGGERQFNGIIDCMKKIVKTDGLKGVYRGFWVSAFGIIVYRGAYFGLYDTINGYFFKNRKLNVFARFLIAHSVVIVSGLVAYPIDTVRRIMMMEAGLPKEKRVYHSAINCAKVLSKTAGIVGFYKGALSNVLVGIGSALILVFFDEIRVFL